jgi:hypothetical protein
VSAGGVCRDMQSRFMACSGVFGPSRPDCCRQNGSSPFQVRVSILSQVSWSTRVNCPAPRSSLRSLEDSRPENGPAYPSLIQPDKRPYDLGSCGRPGTVVSPMDYRSPGTVTPVRLGKAKTRTWESGTFPGTTLRIAGSVPRIDKNRDRNRTRMGHP